MLNDLKYGNPQNDSRFKLRKDQRYQNFHVFFVARNKQLSEHIPSKQTINELHKQGKREALL